MAFLDNTGAEQLVREIKELADETYPPLIQEKAPIDHASDTTTYGIGDDTNYGHVKLSDTPNENQDVGDGVAATPAAVQAAHDAAVQAAIAFEDITSQIVWDSTVKEKQALQIGNLVIIRFRAERSASTAAWVYVTFPSSFAVNDGCWQGSLQINNAVPASLRTYLNNGALELRTEAFSSNASWCQGQIMIVLNAPTPQLT